MKERQEERLHPPHIGGGLGGGGCLFASFSAPEKERKQREKIELAQNLPSRVVLRWNQSKE